MADTCYNGTQEQLEVISKTRSGAIKAHHLFAMLGFCQDWAPSPFLRIYVSNYLMDLHHAQTTDKVMNRNHLKSSRDTCFPVSVES